MANLSNWVRQQKSNGKPAQVGGKQQSNGKHVQAGD